MPTVPAPKSKFKKTMLILERVLYAGYSGISATFIAFFRSEKRSKKSEKVSKNDFFQISLVFVIYTKSYTKFKKKLKALSKTCVYRWEHLNYPKKTFLQDLKHFFTFS